MALKYCRSFPSRSSNGSSAKGIVRAPDVSFLAVEILSASNTALEMDRKLKEYFQARSKLVWYVEPELRTVRVCTGGKKAKVLGAADTLEGGKVLPGFSLLIARWFQRAQGPVTA